MGYRFEQNEIVPAVKEFTIQRGNQASKSHYTNNYLTAAAIAGVFGVSFFLFLEE